MTQDLPIPSMDDINIDILRALQHDARMTNIELARRVNLSAPGLQKRLQKLEESGLIAQYVALLDREKLGYDVLCFVQVALDHQQPAIDGFLETVAALPEVQECYRITGDSDYLLKVVARSRQHLEQLLTEIRMRVPGLGKIQTNIVLSDVKVTTMLPVLPDTNPQIDEQPRRDSR